MRLNQLLNHHKNTKGKDVKADQDDTSFAEVGKFTWCTSNQHLMFLENTINKYTMKPVFSDDQRVPVDWLPRQDTFKPKLATWV